jgi:hypothetical protein
MEAKGNRIKCEAEEKHRQGMGWADAIMKVDEGLRGSLQKKVKMMVTKTMQRSQGSQGNSVCLRHLMNVTDEIIL